MKTKKNWIQLILIFMLVFSLAMPALANHREEKYDQNSLASTEDGKTTDLRVDKINPVTLKTLGTMASGADNPINIILQPQDQSGNIGELFTLSIVALGSNLTYEWYVVLPNTPNEATYVTDEQSWTLPFEEAYDGLRFYCIVKDDKGNEVRSDTATVTVLSNGIVITKQPKSQTGSNGELLLFDIEAKGDNLSYAWYAYHPQIPDVVKEISTEQYWAVEIDEEMNGLCFYCVVSDGSGKTRKSNTVTLTVDQSYMMLNGYTTSLNGTIEMNFSMKLSDDIVKDQTAYMQFELPGSNHTEEKVMLKDARKTTRSGVVYYVFSAGVAAKNMTSDIKAQFFCSNGNRMTKQYVYTIRDYCDYIIDNPGSYGTKAVTLAKAILNYGGYAQLYYNVNVKDLANKNIDSSLPDFSLGAAYKPVTNGSATGLSWLGSTVMTTTATGIRHYFSIDGNWADYTFSVDSTTLSPATSSSGTFVEIPGIRAKELGTGKVLTAKNNKDNTTLTVKYSVYSNIKSVIEGTGYTAKTRNLMKSMYYYCEAVKAYLGTS